MFNLLYIVFTKFNDFICVHLFWSKNLTNFDQLLKKFHNQKDVNVRSFYPHSTQILLESKSVFRISIQGLELWINQWIGEIFAENENLDSKNWIKILKHDLGR